MLPVPGISEFNSAKDKATRILIAHAIAIAIMKPIPA